MFWKKESVLDTLIAKYGVQENTLAVHRNKLDDLYLRRGIENLVENNNSEINEGWTKLVEYSYNGVPLCHDGNSGNMIRFAPKLEAEILGDFKPTSVEFNTNTIDFRTKDVIAIVRNFPEYLEFLRKNYALATIASIVGNKVDSPEFLFFNQISWAANTIGFVGSNPIFGQKLGRSENSKRLELEGKAPLEMYLSDRFLKLYQTVLFERRATKIKVSNDGRVIATKSDEYTKGTKLTKTEFLNLPAISKGIEIQSEKYVLSVNAGEEPVGLLTDLAKSSVRTLRKIPIVGKLI